MKTISVQNGQNVNFYQRQVFDDYQLVGNLKLCSLVNKIVIVLVS